MRIMNVRNGDVVYDANFKIPHSLTANMCSSGLMKDKCARITEHEDPTGGEEGRVWGGGKEINGKYYYPGSGKQLVEKIKNRTKFVAKSIDELRYEFSIKLLITF